LGTSLYLYIMDDPQFPIYIMEFSSLTYLWHKCFGHFNHHNSQFLGKEQFKHGVFLLLENNSICPSYMEGKQSRESIIKIVECCATSSFALVHINLCGMIRLVSLGGAHYLIFFINDFSHFHMAILLETKI